LAEQLGLASRRSDLDFPSHDLTTSGRSQLLERITPPTLV
jgi:hypothetical protein